LLCSSSLPQVLYAARPIEPSAIPRRPSSAQIVVERETQRVYHAWKEADKKAEIAAVVQQLQSVRSTRRGPRARGRKPRT
jgi:hypothetical protein